MYGKLATQSAMLSVYFPVWLSSSSNNLKILVSKLRIQLPYNMFDKSLFNKLVSMLVPCWSIKHDFKYTVREGKREIIKYGIM